MPPNGFGVSIVRDWAVIVRDWAVYCEGLGGLYRMIPCVTSPYDGKLGGLLWQIGRFIPDGIMCVSPSTMFIDRFYKNRRYPSRVPDLFDIDNIAFFLLASLP